MVRPALLGLLTAGALLTAGCGGGGPFPTTRVAQAGAKTTAARTARFSVSATASAQGRTISQAGQGVVDFGRHAVAVKFGQPSQAAPGTPDQQTIIVGTDVWSTTPPSVLAKLATAKPFIHATTAQRNSNPLAQLTQPDDPTIALAELGGVDPTTVTRVGKEDIRGTSTTHLMAQVDLTKVAANDPSAQPQADALQKLLGTNVTPLELWTDGAGRAVRVRQTLQHIRIAPAVATPTTTPASGLQVDLVITNEFFDFGSPVAVNPPPPDQVTEFSQLPA